MNAPGSSHHPEPEQNPRDRNAEGKPENARPRDRFGAPLPRDQVDQMADRVEPEDVVDTVDSALDRAVELFDEERFFEAHEFFEWAWKGPVTPDEQRPLFKGLAQLCVGYTHTQRRNAPGALTLLQRGLDGTEPYLPSALGIDVVTLRGDAEAFRQRLQDQPGHLGPDLDFPRFARG